MKNYTQSPLPFQGQKRRFLKSFKTALKDFSPNATYIDLFGGSGLLSHTVKTMYPNAKVIWNDYDNYSHRLIVVEQTNALLDKIRVTLSKLPRKVKIPTNERNNVLKVIKEHEGLYGYVDYITVSSSLLFSSKYAVSFAELEKQGFYNKVRMNNYNADGYLNEVERVQIDYKTVFKEYNQTANVVFLVDPPYLSTDTSSYSKKDYWKLKDYLDVLSVLDGSKYFYFTSNKSEIVELCEWIETRTMTGNPFAGATMTTTNTSLNHSSSYTDIMLFK